MIYVLAAAAVVALLVWAGRGGLRRLSRSGVRAASGMLWLLLLVAAGLLSLRGAWIWGIVLAVVALGGALGTRRVGPRSPSATPPAPGMSVAEARRILGVSDTAGEGEIQEAYTRLMRMAHPDAGGTSGLAAQLNAARDRLLRR